MYIKNLPYFKILLIIILSCFLYIYFARIDIGRYEALPGDIDMLLDTQTGAVYVQNYEEKAGQYIWEIMVTPVSK